MYNLLQSDRSNQSDVPKAHKDNCFYSEYPGHTVIRPSEFRSQYRNKTLDVFDVVFSFSSLEHSGLGRYGDPLNPWGDIMSVAEAWCVSGPSAKLAMAVPTSVSLGKDILAHNAHRIYGPLMYPFLVRQAASDPLD